MIDLALIAAAAVGGGLWRVTDGGWHRLPYGSNILGYLLPVAFCAWGMGLWGVLPGLIWGRGLTQGYGGWDEYRVMLKRSWFAPAAVGAVLCLSYFGVYEIQNTLLLIPALLVPVAGQLVQPWLRQRADNRLVETMEGASVGLGVALSVPLY